MPLLPEHIEVGDWLRMQLRAKGGPDEDRREPRRRLQLHWNVLCRSSDGPDQPVGTKLHTATEAGPETATIFCTCEGQSAEHRETLRYRSTPQGPQQEDLRKHRG